jgi:hypothetical protein
MNKFYNNNDDFLRRKLVEHEFDALPQAWEQMSVLLDSQPVVTKRSAGYYWWGIPITAALIIGAASGIYYNSDTEKKVSIPATAATETTQPIAATQQTKTAATATLRPAHSVPSVNFKSATANKQAKQETARQAAITDNLRLRKQVAMRTAIPANGTSTQEDAATTAAVPSDVVFPTPTTEASPQQNLSLITQPVTTPRILSEEQKRRVKKIRTEIIYQYSTTPLQALQKKRQQTLGTFGIKEEVDFKKSPIKFGVTVGASAQVPAINREQLTVRPVVGAHASMKLAKRHQLQIGAQYKNLAVDIDEASNTAYNNQDLITVERLDGGMHLLEMPIVYKVSPNLKYNLQAGIKPAVVVGANAEGSKRMLRAGDLGLSSLDFGVLLGAEYNFNEHWSLGLQYTLGLVNLAQEASTQHANYTSMSPTAEADDNSLIKAPNNDTHYIRVPNQLRNSDVQLLLKYNF